MVTVGRKKTLLRLGMRGNRTERERTKGILERERERVQSIFFSRIVAEKLFAFI